MTDSGYMSVTSISGTAEDFKAYEGGITSEFTEVDDLPR